jgi:hypothetical protein
MKFQPTTARASDKAGVGSRASDLRPQTSDLRPQTSDLRPQIHFEGISDSRFEIFRFQTSDFRPPTSDLKARILGGVIRIGFAEV